MEFTYTATLAVSDEEEANDVWKAAEYLQMQEAIKALNNKWGYIDTHPNLQTVDLKMFLFISVTGRVLSLYELFSEAWSPLRLCV